MERKREKRAEERRRRARKKEREEEGKEWEKWRRGDCLAGDGKPEGLARLGLFGHACRND
ncbi:MAG: hypothetical protein LBT40_18830 [Deltaproteobacteria bacterium]|nr:hypothetical protein [Deltaproteobacteria bacterium]